MALREINLDLVTKGVLPRQNTLFDTPPASVLSFLADAEQRVEHFFSSHLGDQPRIPAYGSSNYHIAYNALRNVQARNDDRVLTFCEWGSGFGIVTCLASMLGFKAHGIEIEPELINQAEQLAAESGITASFYCGSYKPIANSESIESFDFLAADFDIIYIYPWPAEEEMIFSLFEHSACSKSVLISYFGGGKIRGWQIDHDGSSSPN